MSQNTNGNSVVNVESNDSERFLFDSYEEASQHRPESAKAAGWKVFKVTRPDGTEVFGWGFNGGVVIDKVARADGYDVCSAESRRSPQLTPQSVLNYLQRNGVTMNSEALLRMGFKELAAIKKQEEDKEAAEKEEISKPSKPNMSKKGNK